MLRESSSHMAILGRKEVHCGKGRVPCAELLQVLAVPSHLEEDTLSQNTLQLELSGALHKPFSFVVYLFEYSSLPHPAR